MLPNNQYKTCMDFSTNWLSEGSLQDIPLSRSRFRDKTHFPVIISMVYSIIDTAALISAHFTLLFSLCHDQTP